MYICRWNEIGKILRIYTYTYMCIYVYIHAYSYYFSSTSPLPPPFLLLFLLFFLICSVSSSFFLLFLFYAERAFPCTAQGFRATLGNSGPSVETRYLVLVPAMRSYQDPRSYQSCIKMCLRVHMAGTWVFEHVLYSLELLLLPENISLRTHVIGAIFF